jgi:hypothetical protein
MRLGDRIVGEGTSTHHILHKQGLAGNLYIFRFVNKNGRRSTGNATAHKLEKSVGAYVKAHYSGKPGVSIYGLSVLDGYHSMLLTYDGTEFALIDQGPATSILSGKSTFSVESVMDDALSEYVRDRQDKRVGKANQYQYPAIIQVYKIYPSKPD